MEIEFFSFMYWQEVRGGPQVRESDIVQACRTVSNVDILLVPLRTLAFGEIMNSLFILQLLEERQSINVWRYLQSMNGYVV